MGASTCPNTGVVDVDLTLDPPKGGESSQLH